MHLGWTGLPIWKLLSLALLLMMCGTRSTLADYLPRPGDVLSIAVIGNSNLDRQVTVNGEGSIFLPLLGEIVVLGKTLPEVRAEIVARFADVAYEVKSADGAVTVQTISPDTVVVDIAEYRPVYVMGDVGNPGEVPYRPGMTAMQALAIAGGVGQLRSSEGAPMMAIQLQSRAEMLNEIIAQHRLAIYRMEADLENLMSDAAEVAAKPEPGEVPSWLEARQTARGLRDQATKVTIENLQRQLEILTQQEEGAQQSVELDTEQVARMEQLAAAGHVTATPLLDARRSLLLSTSRALEIAAERGRLEVQLVELSLADDVEDHTEAAEIIERLEKELSDLILSQEELRGTYARLAEIGYASTEESSPEWVLHREAQGSPTSIAATGATLLEPGDVLEVRIPVPAAEAQALQ